MASLGVAILQILHKEGKQKLTESIYYGSHGGMKGLGNEGGIKSKGTSINRKTKNFTAQNVYRVSEV
jgi:hypothetical protein